MRYFVIVAVLALGMLTACEGPTERPVSQSDLAAFRDFGRDLALIEDNYVRPIDIRTLLVLALLGIEQQTSPAQSAAQPIVQSAIADIQAMPADYALPPTSSLIAATSVDTSKADQTSPYDKLARFSDAVTKVINLPGAPSAPALLQAATVSMIDGIDPMTRYIPASPNGLISAVKPPDMRWRLMGGIFYVHVFTFESDTALQVREMYSQAQRLSGGKLGGVILDLRNNQGGLLDMSAEVAGLFLPDGASIGTIMNRRPHANETLTATSNDITNGLRIVVLVDKQTASGAEIVAGALKFNRRAIVVGETTAGSGFVKTEIPLPGSGILSLVTSTIILPSGQDLQSNGIVPDVIFRQQTGPGGAGASAAVTALGDGDPQNDPEVQEAAKLLM